MPSPLLYVDISRVREGNTAELKAAIDELVAFVDANVPQVVAYNVYLSEDGGRMTVVHMHSESSSLEHLMEVGRPVFRGFAELVSLASIDVYGEPSEKVMSLLRAKAEMLGPAEVTVHALERGFARFELPLPPT